MQGLADAGPLDHDAAALCLEPAFWLTRRNDPGRAQTAYPAAFESGDADTSARAALQPGKRAQRGGDVASARRYYEHTVRTGTGPGVAEAACLLGVQAQRAGDSAAAEAWYRRTMAYEDAEASAPRAAANLGIMRYAAGDVDSARELCRQALDTTDKARARAVAFDIGDGLRRLRAFAEAEPMLRRALQAGHPGARRALGRLLIADGRPDEAVAMLQEAADRNGDTESLVDLGELVVSLADPCTDAAGRLAHGLPTDQAGYPAGSVDHLSAGPKTEEAERCFRLAVADGMSSALAELGSLLMGIGRTAEAEIVLRQAVRSKAENAQTLLGALLYATGRDDEAARIIETAAAAGDPMALMTKASIDLYYERYTEGLEVLRRALDSGGARFGARGLLFVIQVSLADLDAAEATLRQMLTLDDEAGLGTIGWIVLDETELRDGLRQVCATGGDDDIARFLGLMAQSV